LTSCDIYDGGVTVDIEVVKGFQVKIFDEL